MYSLTERAPDWESELVAADIGVAQLEELFRSPLALAARGPVAIQDHGLADVRIERRDGLDLQLVDVDGARNVCDRVLFRRPDIEDGLAPIGQDLGNCSVVISGVACPASSSVVWNTLGRGTGFCAEGCGLSARTTPSTVMAALREAAFFMVMRGSFAVVVARTMGRDAALPQWTRPRPWVNCR